MGALAADRQRAGIDGENSKGNAPFRKGVWIVFSCPEVLCGAQLRLFGLRWGSDAELDRLGWLKSLLLDECTTCMALDDLDGR